MWRIIYDNTNRRGGGKRKTTDKNGFVVNEAVVRGQ
jgi:hypothetical protein